MALNHCQQGLHGTSKRPVINVRQRKRATQPHAAMSSWLNIFRGAKPEQRTPATVKRDQILALLLEPGQKQPSQNTKQELNALIDELAELHVPFKETDLSGGPGVVLYTRGRTALWDAVQMPFRGKGCSVVRASQDLNPATQAVVSKAEFWSPSLFVTATGSYTPLVEGRKPGQLQCPVSIQVDVQEGALHLGSTTIPLPIKGQGLFDVLYCESTLRIFKSGSTLAVQVKESYLDAANS